MNDQVYKLPIEETIKTAWNKIYGVKGTIWVAFIVAIVIFFILGLIDGVLQTKAPHIEPLFSLFFQLISYLINMGLIYMGIKRAFDLPISFNSLFRAFTGMIALKLIGLYILQVLICLVPMLILMGAIIFYPLNNMPIISIIAAVIGAIGLAYLSVRLCLSMGFILDRETGPVNAIKLSFEGTRNNFWRIIGIMIIQTLILLVCIIPLGIGLIWGIPFSLVNFGMVYKNLTTNNIKTV